MALQCHQEKETIELMIIPIESILNTRQINLHQKKALILVRIKGKTLILIVISFLILDFRMKPTKKR